MTQEIPNVFTRILPAEASKSPAPAPYRGLPAYLDEAPGPTRMIEPNHLKNPRAAAKNLEFPRQT